jgi:hypothetical protein
MALGNDGSVRSGCVLRALSGEFTDLVGRGDHDGPRDDGEDPSFVLERDPQEVAPKR